MPPHTYHPELKVNSFYSGLSPITQMMVDNACGGTIVNKRVVEAYDILEKIAQNSQQRTSHGPPKELVKSWGRLKGEKGISVKKSKPKPLGNFQGRQGMTNIQIHIIQG
ncbi:hypothetical protein Dsin_012651 [Dipteronia sinensis]|uniref:Uncharacterized protein n=1 Tax=Dipteronia sinensis TaxID=43782 RepID=A0AAE0AIF8_9ROSI|nr:hypothetical protein Dsin_012651 [Dipteronia sinensis]